MQTVFLPNEDLDIDTDEYFNATCEKDIFKFRTDIERARLSSNPLVLCCACFQPVVIRGNPNRTLFFSHTRNSEDCIIKTTSHLSHEEMLAIKFNGQKEGALHRELKLKLADFIKTDDVFSDEVFVEKTFRQEHQTGIAKKWRRPDVTAMIKDSKHPKKIVFELQISTTFIEVIINRTEFYRTNKVYLIWVFSAFDPDKFTTQDIAAINKSNIFVLDKAAIKHSEEMKQLFLTCFYRTPIETNNSDIVYEWRSELVSFSDLTIENETQQAFYKDPEVLLEQLMLDIKQREQQQKFEEERKQQEKIKQERKELAEREELRLINERALKAFNESRRRTSGDAAWANKNLERMVKPVGSKEKIAVVCSCGFVGKPKKIGRLEICPKCAQMIKSKSN